MGRPIKELSEGLIYKLARINCSYAEMAQIVGVSIDTIERRFAGVVEKGRAQMRQSLKRKQYQVAMHGSGNVTMLIWLGKQHLGQSDKTENVTHEFRHDLTGLSDEQLAQVEQIVESAKPV